MRILLHICCANCAVYPLTFLREKGHDVYGFFYNPNIQPYQEYRRRLDSVYILAERYDLPLITREEYRLDEFLRNTVYREAFRCRYCYHTRLMATAQVAKRGRFDAFTSTLLFSKQQQHSLIAEIGMALGKEKGIPFHYVDFRVGWKKGMAQSLKEGFYRQQYCGCIYSERDRFLGKNRIKPRASRKEG